MRVRVCECTRACARGQFMSPKKHCRLTFLLDDSHHLFTSILILFSHFLYHFMHFLFFSSFFFIIFVLYLFVYFHTNRPIPQVGHSRTGFITDIFSALRCSVAFRSSNLLGSQRIIHLMPKKISKCFFLSVILQQIFSLSVILAGNV